MAKCTIHLLCVFFLTVSFTSCTRSLHVNADQTIFISSDDGSIQALDARNGKSKWQYTIAQGTIDAAPIISDGLVIVGTSADVYAFDVSTGTIKWKQALSGGPVFSARIVDKTIFALASNKAYWDQTGTNFTTLHALDVSTGHIKWSFQAGNQVIRAALSNADENCPFVRNGIVYFGGSDGLFYAIHAEDGTVKWSYPTGSSFYSSPVWLDGSIYIGNANGSLLAMDELTGQVKWKMHDAYTIHAGMTTDHQFLFVPYDGPASLIAYSPLSSNRRWTFTPTSFISSSPVVSNGLLYTGSEDGTFYALDTKTGTLIWKTQLPSSPITIPTLVNNIVYVGAGKTMYALDATTGKQKWAFTTKGNVVKSACIQLKDGTVFRGLGAIQP